MSSNPRNCKSAFTLPIGLFEGRRREHSVHLRSSLDVQGRLMAISFDGTRERAVSALLSVFTASLGRKKDPIPEFFDAMTFADRHALLAHLLIAEGIPHLEAVADCDRCGTRLEFSLDLRSITLPMYDPARPMRLTLGEQTREMRLPTPRDAAAVPGDLDLIAACLGCSPDEAQLWRVAAEEMMAFWDPLGEIELEGKCGECGQALHASCDLAQTWLARVHRRIGEMLSDIHLLASHYHWSERDILALPAARRAAYIDLCWAP